MNGHKLPAEKRAVFIPAQVLTAFFPRYFVYVLEHSFERFIFAQELCRRLGTDARDAGDVVRRVTRHGHEIPHLPGANPEAVPNAVSIVEQALFLRVEHFDVVGNKLKHILVARNNDCLDPL